MRVAGQAGIGKGRLGSIVLKNALQKYALSQADADVILRLL
jgi:hypothetical protein